MLRTQCLRTVSQVLMEEAPIRDTANHYTDYTLNLADAVHWGFDIINTTDQTLTWALLGGISADPRGLGLVGASGAIAAGTTEPILTEIWAPNMAIRISFATAPTRGTVTIIGYKQVVV